MEKAARLFPGVQNNVKYLHQDIQEVPMPNQQIQLAAKILRRGGLVAFPTETVYGLGADAQNELAVRRIFAVKGRPLSHPLIVHVANLASARDWATELSNDALALAEAFWPGPLTLIVRRSQRAIDVVTGGQPTVALRVPAGALAQDLLHAFGGGIAAPSANRFGRVSPTAAEHVVADLNGEVDAIIDGGQCSIGIESTIVDTTSGSPAILRPGAVPREALDSVLGKVVPVRAQAAIRAPGMHSTHYAPRAGVMLLARSEIPARAQAETQRGQRVVVLAPGALPVPPGVERIDIPEDLPALARVLYALLREVDLRGFTLALIELPSRAGLGLAVHDRLSRASGRLSTAPVSEDESR
ncbi:MAG TPA: L-threonylcarbamoyladenylate synthase [Myxococcaceae bacterium]|nr:L-threonylcarbamoyladenylate synthase [Myxococcaceae bacterium]